MKLPSPKVKAIFLLATALSGCAAQGDFPSLAPRPFELAANGPAAQPAEPVALVSSPVLLRRVDGLLAKARQGDVGFNAAVSQARPIIAASDGSVASERWIAAQMALSRVERARADSEAALAEFDDAQRETLISGASADESALRAALVELQAINTRQTATMRTLTAQISRR
jgi:hypothetical protein